MLETLPIGQISSTYLSQLDPRPVNTGKVNLRGLSGEDYLFVKITLPLPVPHQGKFPLT